MLNARNLCILLATALLAAVVKTNAQTRSEGYIDTNFFAACFADPTASTSARAFGVLFDGKIIAAGNFRAPDRSCMTAIARLTANGALDSTFQSPFFGGDFINALDFQGNKLIVGGAMRNANSSFPLARLNANGSVDESFLRALQNQPIVINAIFIQPDGKIVAGGDANVGVAGQQPFGVLYRFDANGNVDNTFANHAATPAVSTTPVIAAIESDAGGKMLVGGTFNVFRGVARPGLARINFDGSLDTNYNAQISDGTIRAILKDSDGKMLVAGLFTAGGQGNRVLARLNSNGTLDNTFAPINGSGTMGLSLLLQPDGKIVLGHSFGVMRFHTNGDTDITFGPRNAFAQLGTEADNVTALALSANTNLIIGAQRVAVNPMEYRGVARLFAFLPPLPPPPVITTQPLSYTVDAGTNVTFSVVATGAPPLRFQWRKDGARIRNATNDTFTLLDVDSTDTATYSVIVSNLGGATTSSLARLTVRFATNSLTLITNGTGAVLPDLTKKPLEIGRDYTITAKPAVGNLFSNWTGGVTSSSPILTFTMQSNLVVVANFVPSPFLPVKGTFSGLFNATNVQPAHENSGFITLTLDDKGGYRGSVKTGTRTRSFKGSFSLDLTTAVVVASAPSAPALNFTLQLDPATQTITGWGSNTIGVLSVFAGLNPFSSANPTADAGLYNAIIEGTPGTARAGAGIVALTVSGTGRVSGRGTLADGTPISIVSALTSGGVPVYVSLYRGTGSLVGWLHITNDLVSNSLLWTKPASAGGINEPAGIRANSAVFGSRYIAPPPRTAVLSLSNAVVLLTGGNLAEDLTIPVTLGSDNKVAGANGLSITISASKGSATGSFLDPATNKKRTVKAIVLPADNQVRGFFLGTDASGNVYLGEAPAE